MKYLKISDNNFLFNVAADPLERANLKDREPAEFMRGWIANLRQAWDNMMLPLDLKASTSGPFTGHGDRRSFRNHAGADAGIARFKQP